MSIIEGIGDEVTHFFIAISVILVASIAWITTDIRQQWNIRTVYLLHRTRARRNRSQRLTNHTESATISEGRDIVETASASEQTNPEGENAQPADMAEPRIRPTDNESLPNNGEESPPTSEEEEIVHSMDGDLIRRRRLQFFDHGGILKDEPTQSTRSTGTEPMRVEEVCTEAGTATDETNADKSSEHVLGPTIVIKLKYINDDLRVVDGRLDEKLGDFKRRHFEAEMTGNKLVRLIFNGKVLHRDNQTLQSYGMFNNCVVHCLIHPNRSATSDNTNDGGNTNDSNLNNNNQQQRDWDLGNLMIATVSFCLGSAWYFRYQYPQLFTITATVGLVAITGIFTVISIGMYFPDNERTQSQSQPTEQSQQQLQPTAAAEVVFED